MMTRRFPLKLNYLRDTRRAPHPPGREPVTVGLPFPPGMLMEPVRLGVDEGTGRAQRVQSSVTDRWSDGSVRWILLDWLSDPAVDSASLVDLSGEDSAPDGQRAKIRIEEHHASGLRVDTGALSVVFSGESNHLFRVVGQKSPVLLTQRCQDGVLGWSCSEVQVELAGRIRSTILVKWTVTDKDGSCVSHNQARCHFFAECAAVKLEVSIQNPRAAHHPGGIWTLGSKGALMFDDLVLEVPLPEGANPAALWCSTELGQPLQKYEAPFDLYQESSGGQNWNSRNHLESSGRLAPAYRGFKMQSGTKVHRGLRATPLVLLETTQGWTGCGMQYFWENFPKSIGFKEGRIEVGLFPDRGEALHELQGGERKTHELVVWFGEDSATSPGALDWGRSPSTVRADPAWYREAEAVPFLVPAANDSNEGYKSLVGNCLDWKVGFLAKREAVDEFGWRHFGDLYADHEAAFHTGSEIFLSHYNNQYDAVAGFATQFFRDGKADWYRWMDELARHVMDIDVYHTDRDKSTYNHGQFWHTIHYIDAGASTHRAYPPAEGVNGGGPSTGNLYTHGLLLHHYLTGSLSSREAVLSLGQYVIDADNGRLTVFRFLDRGYTGHVSESGFDGYHGPGRSPANAVSALLDAYRLSGEPRFLDKAEQLIRRCIHPADDIEARQLRDSENRWFYTMFLQSLGKYLLLKIERGQDDLMFHYARVSLLRYADWAVENEQPYLDRPEVLEFPTETWAAQDMRKCEMLNLASLFAEPVPAEKMRRRARFFFDRSVEQLESADTRSFCRPLVLLLSNGVSQAYFDRDCDPFPGWNQPEDREFGEPERFDTQKRRAVRRGKWLAGFSLLVGALTLIWIVINL